MLKGLFFIFLVLTGSIHRCAALTITDPFPPQVPFFMYIPGPVSLNEDTSVAINFFPTNNNGHTLTYVVHATHGTVSGSGTEWTYVPDTNFFGAAPLGFSAYDALMNATYTSSVSITVNPEPDPPVANFTIPPAIFFPGFTNPVVIAAACDQPAQLTFDGSASSDPDQDTLAYAWINETNYLGNGVTTTATLDVGVHTVMLFVTDGIFTNSAAATFEVISPCAALANVQQICDQAVLPNKLDRRLRPMLTRASNQLAKGKTRNARNELKDFRAKLNTRLEPLNADLAGQLETLTQEIIDALPDPRQQRTP